MTSPRMDMPGQPISDTAGRPLGVAIAGFWHVHAGDYARMAREHPGTRLVAGWDADAQRAAAAGAEWGVPVVADLDELLDRDDVDAVVVTTATVDHTDVIGRCLRAGKHVFTEKLLAATVSDSESLIDQARERGLALVVSLPRWDDALAATVVRLIRSGDLGEVTYARVRMAHDGWVTDWLPERFSDPAEALGGALTDLGCHPVYLIQRFLGPRPATVAATYGSVTGRAVEDNAVVVAGYRGGAVGVAEASFVTTPGAFAVEVRGTRASLLYGLGRESLSAKGGRFGDEWTEVPLDEAGPAPFDLWVDASHGSADPSTNQQAAVDLTRMVVAANDAARSRTAVDLTDTNEKER